MNFEKVRIQGNCKCGIYMQIGWVISRSHLVYEATEICRGSR